MSNDSAPQWRSVMRFAARRQRAPIAVAVVVLLVGVAVALTQHSSWFGGTWGVIDALVTVATLLTAQVVWWTEAGQEWRASLPPRISVSLWFEDALIARCDHAPLVGDPRAFAQQIGSQMLGGQRLVFWPVLEGTQPEVERWKEQWVVHHNLNIVLRELPSTLGHGSPATIWNHENQWGRLSDAGGVATPR